MFGSWLAVAEGTLLGFEAQRVIALRAMKIAAGGSSARSEVSRMVTEKVSAGAEAVAILTRGGSGRRVIRRYRTRVKANVRRVSRSARVTRPDPNVAVRNENSGTGEQFLPPLVVPASKFEMNRHSVRARPGAVICEVQVSHDSARDS
jgi:hypothetical protein